MRTTGTTYNRSAKAQRTQTVSALTPKNTMPTLTSFNDKLTLRELLTMIRPTKGVALPTAKTLRESDKPIAVYATRTFSISVYPSGFALAKSYKRTTVVRVDECGSYEYDTAHKDLANRKKSATPSHIGMEVFLDTAWPVRVTLTTEDRLEANNNGSAWSKICLHPEIAADVREYNRSVHEESAEDQVIKKMEKEEMLREMTDKQREVYKLYYHDGYTQTEIGEMLGISSVAVNNRLSGALKKIRKYMAENK